MITPQNLTHNMRQMALPFTVVFSATFGLLIQSTPARGADYSDLALASENVFISVNDRKTPIHPGHRVALVTVTADKGVVDAPIAVDDWQDRDGAPSDLEACCVIPGRDHEFLLAESGLYKSKFGRIFHVSLGTSDEGTPAITVEGVMRVYDRTLDGENTSFEGDLVEGIECFRAAEKLFLVFGERGGPTSNGTKLGTIVWGEVDLANHQFQKLGESELVSRSVLGQRDCSTLHLSLNDEGAVSVLSVATKDPGDDGPFESAVYLAGRIVLEAQPGFVRESSPHILARCAGIKIEGLTPRAAGQSNGIFSIATDDENFGGILRQIELSH